MVHQVFPYDSAKQVTRRREEILVRRQGFEPRTR